MKTTLHTSTAFSLSALFIRVGFLLRAQLPFKPLGAGGGAVHDLVSARQNLFHHDVKKGDDTIKSKELWRIGGLGVTLVWLVATTNTFANIGDASAKFNDYRDFGCRLAPEPSPAVPANQAHCVPCNGSPVWWVNQPSQNVWVADEPLSYFLSSGQRMSFRWTYRQRYQVPDVSTYFQYGDGQFMSGWGRDGFTLSPYRDLRMFGTTNGAWYCNWLSDITFWDYNWEHAWPGPFPTLFANCEAFWYRPEGGIIYFPYPNYPDNSSRLKLESSSGLGRPTVETAVADGDGIYWGGTQTNGFRVVYPDGSKDVYGLAFYLAPPHNHNAH